MVSSSVAALLYVIVMTVILGFIFQLSTRRSSPPVGGAGGGFLINIHQHRYLEIVIGLSVTATETTVSKKTQPLPQMCLTGNEV